VPTEFRVPFLSVDKILHDGWRWVLKSGVVMCSSVVRNAA
jgi:hypothetical protein